MPSKTVFIATHRRGFETDPVMKKFRSMEIPVFRYNADSGVEASQITTTISHDRVSSTFECDDRLVNADDIGVAWFQQSPPYLGQPCDTTASLQQENLLAAYLGAMRLIQAPWLNHPDSVLYFDNKILQLAIALRVGFKCMPSLISNRPSDIVEFAGRHQIIAKNLATPWVDEGETTLAAYTKLVQPEWLVNPDELKFCPIIYQKYCKRKADYRVVVVGDKVFPIVCYPNNQQMEDIRRSDRTGESYQACSFDEGLITKLQKLMEQCKIQYCSADFMEDEKGEIYFLETNLCGSWWWVDRLYDGKICDAIVSYLVARL